MVDTIAVGRAMQVAREKARISKQQLADASGISVKASRCTSVAAGCRSSTMPSPLPPLWASPWIH